MNIEDASPHEKECCKAAILAHKQEVLRKYAKIESIQIRAVMVLMAIGIPIMLIVTPPKIWDGIHWFIVILSVLGWTGLIGEFRTWMKTRKSIKREAS